MRSSIWPTVAASAVSAFCGIANAQTQVDLRTQAKTVDFRAAASTKPVKSGDSLPATCAQAEMFFLTTAPAGSNLFGCPATNTWVAVSGGTGSPGGSTGQCQFNDAGLFGGDSGCIYNKNTQELTAVGGFRSGDGTKSSGLILPELAANGDNYFAIYGAASQAESGCIIVSGSPSAAGDVLAFTGMTATTNEDTPKTCKVMEWVVPPGQMKGSAVLDFPSIGNGQCVAATFAIDGVLAGDRIAPGFPVDLESGLLGTMNAPEADTVQVQLCNLSGATVDPASGTYSAAVL